MKDINEHEAQEFIIDSVNLLKDKQAAELSSVASSAPITNALTNDVEFWKWMGRNYPNDFGSAEKILNSMEKINGGMRNTVQGKGYEWDWTANQRNQIKNVFSKFFLGDNPTQEGIDVAKATLLTGKADEFQLKAYTSANMPDLHNTPQDTVVVTNAEKVANAQKQSYSVEPYKTSNEIIKDTNKRIDSLKGGKANLTYNLKNIAASSAKAGALGFVIGAGIETIASYRRWKNGGISKEEYIKEILLSGGNSGITAAGTSCIMIPISAAITAAGVSSFVTFPIAIVVGATLSKIISPAFKRGDYVKYLNQAKYYENLTGAYKDFIECAEDASLSYENFIYEIGRQQYIHGKLREADIVVTGELIDLYNKI